MTLLPKENEQFPGFYDIPGYPGYVIAADGYVLNTRTKTLLKGSYNPAGYLNYRLTNPSRVTHTWGRHRLMAFVFKHPGKDVSNLVVNHKNGIKGDDWLDNLEWMTHQGNIEHAGENRLTEKCRPIFVRDIVTHVVMRYPSVAEAVRDLRLTKDAILYRLEIGPTRIFPEQRQYRYVDDERGWFDPENIEDELLKNGRAKKVVARGLLTGVTRQFESIERFCEAFNFSPSSVTKWLSQGHQSVLPGLIQVKSVLDKTPWREVKDPYAELEKTTGQKVVRVKNPASGEQRIFTSAVSCARHMNLLSTTLNHRLKTNGTKVYPDGYTYAYYNTKNQETDGPTDA